MARKRKHRVINWGPTLWLLTIINVLAGMTWSPITATRRLRVEGDRPFDHERLTQDAQKLCGVPCLRIDRTSVETRAMALDDVDLADFSANIFGSGVLRMRYREPVARISGSSNQCATITGQLFRSTLVPDNLPRIEPAVSLREPSASLFGSWEMQQLAAACTRLEPFGPPGEFVLTVDSQGIVCLNRKGQGRVILGSPAQFDAAFQSLKTILQKNPDFLKEFEELNLIAPDKPVGRRAPPRKNS